MKQKILIYQVLPRLYGNKRGENATNGNLQQNGCGKLNDFTAKALKRVKDFGFSHIWYTGLLEHATKTDYSAYGIAPDHHAVVKGNAGSPYAIKDYYDIDPDLAVDVSKRMAEFEALVKRTHKAGLKMIIDFVPNHVARQYHSDAKPEGVEDLGAGDNENMQFSADNNFYYVTGLPLRTDFDLERTAETPYHEFPAKATGNDRFDAAPGRNDWYETVKLNYGVDYLGGHAQHFSPIPSTWKKMTNILLFWAAKGIDGFRCDMAEMVPCAFWHYAIAKVKEKYPEIIFIAEVYNPHEYRNYIFNGGFDYLYDKVGLYDTLRAVTCCGLSATSITGCWQSVGDIAEHMLNFLENHDEQRIASDFFAGNAQKAFPALVVSTLMRGNPMMIYAGQELGERGMDAEGFSGKDGRTTIFDYWCVNSLEKLSQGEASFSESEAQIYDFYKKVTKLAAKEKAIREGMFYDLMYVNLDHAKGFNPDRQFAFIRKAGNDVMLICANFSEQEANAGIRIPAEAYDFLKLRTGLREAQECLSGESVNIELKRGEHTKVSIPPLSAVVLKWKN